MTRDSVMPSSSLDFNLDTVENNPFPEVDIDLRSPEEIVLDEQTRVRNILATGNNFSLDNFYGNLRTSDTILLTRSTNYSSSFSNLLMFEVVRIEDFEKGRKDIKLRDKKSGEVYYISRDCILGDGSLKVISKSTQNPVIFHKIHAIVKGK